MRTTISINDTLLREAKKLAVERNQTLGAVVEDALRSMLRAHSPTRAPSKPTRLLTFRGNGVQPGVDLNSSASLLDKMEDKPRLRPIPGPEMAPSA